MKSKYFFSFKPSLIYSLSLITLISTSLIGCSSETTNATTTTDTTIETASTTDSQLLIYGEVKIDEIEELQLDFPARITNIHVKEGSIVNKGDVLIDLDFNDYKLQIATLEKELNGYELELKGLKANTNATAANLDAISKELALKKSYTSSGQDPDIIPLQNNLTTLNEELAQAKKLYDSNLSLFEIGGLSETELTQSKLNCDKLTQQIADINTSIQKINDSRALEIASLQSKLNATTLEVSNIDSNKAAQINQLQVKIESTLLNLENMKSKLNAPYLNNTQLIAPKDGLIIYDVVTNSGSSVSGLGQSLIRFMDLSKLYVVLDIPEESLTQVSLNAPVTLLVADQNMTTPITGTVSRVSSYAVEKEGDVVVEAYIEVTEGIEYLKPGLSIDAYVEIIS